VTMTCDKLKCTVRCTKGNNILVVCVVKTVSLYGYMNVESHAYTRTTVYRGRLDRIIQGQFYLIQLKKKRVPRRQGQGASLSNRHFNLLIA